MSQREAYYLQRQVSGSQIPWGYFSDEQGPPPTEFQDKPVEPTLPKTPPKQRLEQAEREEKAEEIDSEEEGKQRKCFQDLSCFTRTGCFFTEIWFLTIDCQSELISTCKIS